MLPPLMIDANLGPNFTLQVQSAAYAGMMQVYATAHASPGRNLFSPSDYKLIGTVSAQGLGGTHIEDVAAALRAA